MFEVKINTDGAAFEAGVDAPEIDEIIKEAELKYLLEKIIKDIYRGKREGSVIDSNGNKVGEWRLD